MFNTTPILQQGKLSRKTDAIVRVTRNQQQTEEIRANSQGIYQSTQLPALGDRFDVELVNNNEVLSSSSSVPGAVEISDGEFQDVLTDIDAGKYGYPAQFTFSDPENEVNYYAFEVIVEDCAGGCSEETIDGVVNELLIEDVKVNTSGNIDVDIGGGPERIDGLRYIYFNDDDLDGKSVTIRFYIIPVELDLEENRNVIVKYVLKSITKEYYDYLKTCDFQAKTEDGNSFSEPVQIATNIKNGLGTFAGYSISVLSITPKLKANHGDSFLRRKKSR